MSNKLRVETVARLRELIAGMERDLGLTELSPAQLDVLYAVRLVCDATPDAVAETANIRRHPILQSMSQPTFHRALRILLNQGYVAPNTNGRTKRYVIAREPGDS